MVCGRFSCLHAPFTVQSKHLMKDYKLNADVCRLVSNRKVPKLCVNTIAEICVASVPPSDRTGGPLEH